MGNIERRIVMQIVNIADQYTKTPGGRFRSEGKYSGEDFRQMLLKPKYLLAKKNGEELEVNLDGGYGYATSFLEEAFGGLVRDLGDKDILKIIIISEEEPELKAKVYQYIKDALMERGIK